MKRLAVHELPKFVTQQELAGTAVVVIDLLRASTTICTALANGATEVWPFLEVEETQQAIKKLRRSAVLLGGERNGRLIAGFDLGNSPAEYTPSRVAGKQILFTTTNGTRALQHARLAMRVVIGAMVNLSPVAKSIRDEPNVHILCAGTGGKVTREDILAAGALVDRLVTDTKDWRLSEPAAAALGRWRELKHAARTAERSLSEQLAEELRQTPGGVNLLAIGHGPDLALCAQIDTLSVVPQFNPAMGSIALP
jgi:2-phosphosulfolactate phosphatase